MFLKLSEKFAFHQDKMVKSKGYWWKQKIAPRAEQDYKLARAIERTFSIICKYLNLVTEFEASFIATRKFGTYNFHWTLHDRGHVC